MNQQLTDITVVLDRSGSMQDVVDDTIGGFNAFLKAQRENTTGECKITLTQFDDVYEVVYADKPVGAAPDLNHKTYVPRASTALLDAIGRTINEKGARFAKMPEAERPGKVVFVIVTDGHENASREFDLPRVHDMINHQRKDYAWDFVFLGANQDAIAAGAGLGIAGHKSMTYAGNAAGMRHAFRSASNYVVGARGMSVTDLNAHGFTEEDRQQQEDAGGKP